MHLKINKIRLSAKIETEHLQITNKLSFKNNLSSKGNSSSSGFSKSGLTEAIGKTTLNQIDETEEKDDEAEDVLEEKKKIASEAIEINFDQYGNVIMGKDDFKSAKELKENSLLHKAEFKDENIKLGVVNFLKAIGKHLVGIKFEKKEILRITEEDADSNSDSNSSEENAKSSKVPNP